MKLTHGPQSFAAANFVTPQPSELLCVKCKRVPQTPKRSKCCNTLYCEACSQTVINCPVHKQSIEYATDTSLKNRIYKLIIRCGNKCGWKGPAHKLKHHLPDCAGNAYTML